jgi:MFS transporter, YNFM family, putative membrane transport protein
LLLCSRTSIAVTIRSDSASRTYDDASPDRPGRPLLALILALVACAFTTVYITQPVLPILQAEFGVTPTIASLSVSVVILGMAITTLPFGMLADRYPLRRLILVGGCVVAGASVVCAITASFVVLVAMRAVQGAFMPALTVGAAAWLSRALPVQALNVAMGMYVAATVAGGLGGRLLAGWVHSPLHWRNAFMDAGLALLAVTLLTAWRLGTRTTLARPRGTPVSLLRLVTRRSQMLAQIAAFGAFGAFSTVFNYFPFYLAKAPWSLATGTITSLYLVYVAGLLTGPLAGKLGNRFGNGMVMAAGALLLAVALLFTFIVAIPVLVASLIALCAGFFAVHACAVGALNRSLSADRGKANALYTLFYYVGGAVGITAGGGLYARFGWEGVVAAALAMSLLPLGVGVMQWNEPDS